SLLTGIAVVFGYTLLGATWLIYKTVGPLQERMQSRARTLAVITLGFIGIVSAVTPFLDPVYADRWFAWPTAVFSAVVPVLLAGAAWRIYVGLRDRHDATPFLASLALFILSFIGIGISFYPHIVPPSLTIAEAAAPESSLAFTLVGAALLLPLILAYTAYSYWVFRGKMDPDEGYH
ncbi:MAG: cytochrome d ubiquinol oxidase subunit II, partial [Aestuariivirgaceae bacterium]